MLLSRSMTKTNADAPDLDLLSVIESFDQQSVLVIGDVMYDRFVYGSASRISPEAPVPVLAVTHETTMLGGAGNVVRNVLSLGAAAGMMGVIGDDAIAQQIQDAMSALPRAASYLVTEHGRTSSCKIRHIAAGQQLLRSDHEDTRPVQPETMKDMQQRLDEVIADYHVVILSDYAKGVLHPEMIRYVIDTAAKHGIPCLVDPKQADIALYRGVDVMTPNEKEMILLHGTAFENDTHMAEVASGWCRNYAIGACVVTLGARGMMLVRADGLHTHVQTQARDVYDVSGAGDTVIATLALALSASADLQDAVTLANQAAGVVVGRLGTAVIYRTDLKAALYTASIRQGQQKLCSLEVAHDTVAHWKAQGLHVGFTNGCFDVIHTGHLASLAHCKAHCDRLVIAINSDRSVKRLKGEARPINAEMDRAMMLAALSDVDMVVIFREDTPEALLEQLRPDVLMKGEDYERAAIIGADFVESYGGKVVRIRLVKGYSTTNTIARIRQPDDDVEAV